MKLDSIGFETICGSCAGSPSIKADLSPKLNHLLDSSFRNLYHIRSLFSSPVPILDRRTEDDCCWIHHCRLQIRWYYSLQNCQFTECIDIISGEASEVAQCAASPPLDPFIPWTWVLVNYAMSSKEAGEVCKEVVFSENFMDSCTFFYRNFGNK
ncbi:hypothetical protein OROMI_032878 [Orobanche minor]